jgi:hypothetical protein
LQGEQLEFSAVQVMRNSRNGCELMHNGRCIQKRVDDWAWRLCGEFPQSIGVPAPIASYTARRRCGPPSYFSYRYSDSGQIMPLSAKLLQYGHRLDVSAPGASGDSSLWPQADNFVCAISFGAAHGTVAETLLLHEASWTDCSRYNLVASKSFRTRLLFIQRMVDSPEPPKAFTDFWMLATKRWNSRGIGMMRQPHLRQSKGATSLTRCHPPTLRFSKIWFGFQITTVAALELAGNREFDPVFAFRFRAHVCCKSFLGSIPEYPVARILREFRCRFS